MPITSIGNDADSLGTAELIATLAGDLGKAAGNAAKPVVQLPGTTPVTDVAAVLLSQVATSDLTKLTGILHPSLSPDEDKILDTLLRNAIQEVAEGNAERAIGYLADYATRDPRRAETLLLEPALEQVRDKIDSMVNRMMTVAKMSAENGLSRADQVTSPVAGKLVDWDTRSDVLLQLAHRLFESGGYANYSRTAELARMVTDAVEARPVIQALAASASSAGAQIYPHINQIMPGVNVPYWVSPDVPIALPEDSKSNPPGRASHSAMDDIRRNLSDLKEISENAFHLLWKRAPLLVMMLVWFAIGLAGGLAFAVASRFWAESLIVSIGNFAFDLWGIGFLALVGFGFYVRVRYRPLY